MKQIIKAMQRLGLAVGLAGLLVGGILSPFASATSQGDVSTNVVNGRYSSTPWAVSIQTLGLTNECGGTLIAPQWVLTAAHCTEIVNSTLSYARIGTLYRTGINLSDPLNPSNSGQFIKVSQVIPHPDFPKADGSFGNDIALLKLARPVTATPSTIPYVVAPLLDVDNNSVGIASGWGTTCDDDINNPLCSLAQPNKLKEVDLTRVADSACTLPDPANNISDINDPTTMDCFVASSGLQEGICFGDSGGPLMQQQNGNWVLVGLINADMDSTTAHRDICSTAPDGGTNHQATTDVWFFRDWISQTIAAN